MSASLLQLVLGDDAALAATWRDAQLHGRACGCPDPDARAWGVVAQAQELQARVGRHRLLSHRLELRASPEDYDTIVGTLSSTLAAEFRATATDGAERWLQEMAAIGASGRASAMREAEEVLARAAKDLGLAGKKVSPARADAFIRSMGAAYTLGKTEVSRPLGWSLSTDLPDRDAVAGLSSTGLLWVGDAYGERLDQRKLLDVVERDIVRGGLGTVEAGKRLRAAFEGEIGRSTSYWEMLATTAATRARTSGKLAAFGRCGVVTYEYMNPVDERTSDVCRALDGKRFNVKTSQQLHERMIGAQTPDELKAIAPWPRTAAIFTPEGAAKWKAGELKDANGQLDRDKADPYLKPTAELQSAGIAFPPLHGRCRSTIEVAEISECDATALDPVGNVEPDRSVPPPPAAPKKRKPKDKPTETASDWTTRRKAWKSTETAAKARGLDLDDVVPSRATLEELRRLTVSYAERGRPLPPATTAFVDVGPGGVLKSRPVGRDGWQGIATELESGPAAGEAGVAALRADLDALDAYEQAYCDAMRAAPFEVAEKEARGWARKIADRTLDRNIPSDVAAEIRAEVEDTVSAAFGPDVLHVLAREGVRLRNLTSTAAARPRAFARVGSPFEAPSAHVPKRYAIGPWAQSVRPTIVHELAHTLDCVLGGRTTGRAWSSRPGLPDAETRWTRAYGSPFRRMQSGGVARLPGEVRSAYYLQGSWVEAYEGRIYATGVPDAAAIAAAGPVEFIGQSGTYRWQHQEVLRTWLQGRVDAAQLARELTGTAWYRASMLYGAGYRNGVEAISGQPFLRELGRLMASATPPTFATPEDAVVVALLLAETTSTPLAAIIGPGGPLAAATAPAGITAEVWAGWSARLDAALSELGAQRRRWEVLRIVGELQEQGRAR